MLDDHVSRLAEILSHKRPGYLSEAEACLADMAGSNDPASIRQLVLLLDDAAPDELMFSIVHAMERWNDEPYLEAIVDSVNGLWQSAPRWAQILHIRIMNSPDTARVYLERLESAPAATRTTVCRVYEAVAENWPGLAGKVDSICARLKR